jgi:ABC-type Fe3+-hydroxamate transport system substrate-binding protein
MILLTRHAIGAAGLAFIMTTAAVAQPAPTVRVRGEITKVEGTTLTVKSRSGEMLTVKLAEPPRIAAMVKSSLADIKEGSFIGVSGMPQPDGTQKAYGVHIFMDSQKGVVADRFSDWDGRPGSTMTNANVATTVSGNDGQNLLVKYKDGEKKVIIPPGTPIAKYAPGGPEDLKVGAKVFVGAATKQADGTLLAPNIAVGRDIDPPQ